MHIAIIGAGPTGLSAAYELLKAGNKVTIYEKGAAVGGLAKTINFCGQNVEMGPHFLDEQMNEQTRKMLMQIGKENFHQYERLTRLYINGSYINYPPRPIEGFKHLGVMGSVRASVSLLRSALRFRTKEVSFESYISTRLGEYIYKNLVKEYTEKLWGIPCHLISEDYGKALVGFGKFDLAKILKMFLSGKDIISTAYLYPKGGMSQIWNDLQERIEGYGGVFRFGSMLNKVVIKENVVKGIGLKDGSMSAYDHIISTIPENMILRMIEDVPDKVRDAADSIEYRDVVCVFLKIQPVEFMEDNNLYIYNKTIQAVRITNYNRFKNAKGNDILMLEYWIGSDSDMSSADPEGMLNIVKNDLANLSHFEEIRIVDHKIIRLNKAYPIPTLHLQKSKAEISGFLANISGLLNTGRANQANFNFGMAEAIDSGIAAAASIVNNG